MHDTDPSSDPCQTLQNIDCKLQVMINITKGSYLINSITARANEQKENLFVQLQASKKVLRNSKYTFYKFIPTTS